MAERYSAKELAAIIELTERIRDLDLDEEDGSHATLVKFVRAQCFDIPKADNMLRKYLAWRRDNDIDAILKWIPPDELYNAYPISTCGYDDEGNAILIRPMKYHDMGLFSRVSKEDLIKFRIQSIEKVLEEMRRRNRALSLPGNQVITIVDFEGFNLRSLLSSKVVEVLKTMADIEETNYPDLAKMVFVTYAPRMITLSMSIAKYVIPKSTLTKVKIYGSDMNKWGADICQHVPFNQIPPRFGGTNIEFDKRAFKNVQNTS